MVNRSREIMKDARYYDERRAVQEFLRHIGEDDGLVTYGEKEVFQAIEGIEASAPPHQRRGSTHTLQA